MRKPIEEKPPLAAWATLSRESAGMSVEEAVAALAERGHAVTAATIRGIEGGSKGASARLQKLLAIVYGVTPPGRKEAGPPEGAGMVELVQAIREQTAAMLELVSELRSARSQPSDLGERVAAVEAYAAEHERRLQADRELMGLDKLSDEQLGSQSPAGVR